MWSNGRIMVYWSANHWSQLMLPLDRVVHADTPAGAGNLVMTKQKRGCDCSGTCWKCLRALEFGDEFQ